MFDLGPIAEAYTKAIAGIGGIDAVTNLLSLIFLAVCVALALRGPAVAFGATMLAWVVTVRLPVFVALLGNPDEAAFLAATRRLFYDPVFWRSVDGTTSGPFNYYPVAALRLLGLPLNFPTARLANILCVWGAVLLLWMAARTWMPEWAARLSVLPWIAAASEFRFGEFLQYGSECVALLLGSLAVLLLVRAKWLPLGIVLVCMPLAKLQALPLAAVLGISAAARLWQGERRELLRLAAGAAAALLTLVLYLAALGLWPDFVQSYLRNNLGYANSAVVQWSLGEFFAFIANSELARFLAWMALWILPVIAWRRSVSSFGLMAAALFASALYAAYRPGRPFPHYLLFLMLPVTLGGMAALAAAVKNLRRPKLAVAAFIAVTLVAPAIQAMADSPPDAFAALASASPAMAAPIVSRLNAWARPGDLVAVWGWAAELNVLTGTVTAQRDPQTERAIVAGPQRDYYRTRYVQDLKSDPPRVFVDSVGPMRLVFQDRATQGYESIPALREFVDANYDLQEDVQGVRVFARKGARPIESESRAALPLTLAAGSSDDRYHYGGGRLDFREETAPAGYRSARFCRSTCEYSIPLENGRYRVRLHFIELVYPAPAQRTFHVTLNQAMVLRDFDIFREAGALATPVIREFEADVNNGRLTIGLLPHLREAAISRIEVLK